VIETVDLGLLLYLVVQGCRTFWVSKKPSFNSRSRDLRWDDPSRRRIGNQWKVASPPQEDCPRSSL